ncbi:MAG: DUF3307 domain-containing protein [Xanthomonadales bacterium]|nr:DUF3307 domain-containing protein [Xanthomonadales bacterium]
MALFFELLVGHVLADYVFQRQIMATSKTRHAEIFKTAGPRFPPWYYWLISHSLVHGGAVYFITGSLLLGVVETVLHALIDHAKCEHKIGVHTDQGLHILCKVAYVFYL